jgi:hypothetical protein
LRDFRQEFHPGFRQASLQECRLEYLQEYLPMASLASGLKT